MLPLVVFAQSVAMHGVLARPPRGAQADVAPRLAPQNKPLRTPPIIGRLSAGLGPAMPSAQEGLLQKEGYGGVRWSAILDLAGRLQGRFLLGGFVGGSLRNAQPSRYYGPELSEDVLFAGAEGMFLPGVKNYRFPIVARLGLARGRQSLHGDGAYETAPVVGAEIGFMPLHFPMGAAIGALFAPASPPGQLGESWNMGTIYFSLVFNVHD